MVPCGGTFADDGFKLPRAVWGSCSKPLVPTSSLFFLLPPILTSRESFVSRRRSRVLVFASSLLLHLYINTDDDDVDDATTRVIKASTIILSLSLSLFLDHNHNKQTT